ncbi:MAG TPA: DUF5074 domain-containing protein [Kofleriaceae bacterium]
MFVSILAIAACGDNKNKSAPDAAAGSIDAPMADAQTTPRAIVVAPSADFKTPPGIMSELDVASRHVTQNLAAGEVGADPFLRNYGGFLYIINRDGGDNITIVDATTLAFVSQIATGTSSNPQDVAVVGDKLYVPVLGGSGVAVLSQSQQTMTGAIDLNAATGETDGFPDCVSAYTVGTDVYVACDIYNESTFANEGNGKIVVIDSTTDTVRTTITLDVENPQNEFQQLPDGDLVISAEPLDSGSDEMTGCVARITPGATPTQACLLHNTDLDGIVDAMAISPAPNPMLYITVTSFDFSASSLSTWDMAAAMPTNGVSPASEFITDVAACPDGTMIVADQTMAAPGLRLYKGSTELTTAALPFGLAPGDGNDMTCYVP